MEQKGWKAEAQPEVRKSMVSPGSWMKPAERSWTELARTTGLWMTSMVGTQELGGWMGPAEEGGPGNYSDPESRLGLVEKKRPQGGSMGGSPFQNM